MNAVTVVDYGLGNLFNLAAALRAVGGEVTVTDDPAAIARAERLILPGVGAFGPGIDALRHRSLEHPLHEFRQSSRPLLGICLGMQFLMTTSEEDGLHRGLGYIEGRVVKFKTQPTGNVTCKVPQVSWNTISPNDGATRSWADSILTDVPAGAEMYFVHSYYVETASAADTTAFTTYASQRYSSVVSRDNVVGVQFHPERSAEDGLKILRAFLQQ
jgi:glutamine amidotransferase